MDKESAERKEAEGKILIPSKHVLSEAENRPEYEKVFIEGVEMKEGGQYFQLVTFDSRKGEFTHLKRGFPETQKEISKYYDALNHKPEILILPGKEVPANTTIEVAKKKGAPEIWDKTTIMGVVQKFDRRYFLLKIKEENTFRLWENSGQATDEEYNTYRNLLARIE